MAAQVSLYANNVMKDDLGIGLKNAINNNNVIWAEIARNTEDVVGLQAVWPVHTGRSNATGNRAELATLPTADRQRYVRAADDLKFIYHTIKVSGPAKHLTRNDEGAFVRAVESEVRGAERDLKHDLARQTFGQKVTINGTPMSGILATVTAKAGAVATFGNEPTSIIRHFHAGMLVGFVIPATGAFRTGVYEVVSTSPSAKTVTFAQALDAAIVATDCAVRVNGVPGAATVVTQSNLDEEINGLRFLIGAAPYAGINPATNPLWASVTLGSGATAISEVILDEAVEKVETDGSGDSPTLYITEHSQRRKMASLLQTMKQYDGREMTLTSGWKGLNVARGTLVVDRYAPSNQVFVLNMPDIELFVGLDFQWDEDDGEVFFKSPNQDAIEARYKAYLNLETLRRNSHSVITLAEPTF